MVLSIGKWKCRQVWNKKKNVKRNALNALKRHSLEYIPSILSFDSAAWSIPKIIGGSCCCQHLAGEKNNNGYKNGHSKSGKQVLISGFGPPPRSLAPQADAICTLRWCTTIFFSTLTSKDGGYRYIRLLLLLVFFWQFFVGYQDVVFSPVYLGKLAIIGCFFSEAAYLNWR